MLGDALDPGATQTRMKGRRQLAEYGWRPGSPNPAQLLFESRDLDAARLRNCPRVHETPNCAFRFG
ncbi:hypothetical protein [Nonomuraea helvata]|uniref:Uncharacterized protein n=1 Tax=Nonomuraea helvata TaxID=37484 RepID=A0ABV5SH97_9ACTN